MTTSKEEARRLKFLQMAKKFNWNLSKLPKRQTRKNPVHSHHLQQNNSFHPQPITINKNILSTPLYNNTNNNTTTQNVNNSIIDSEATESEDDNFQFKKQIPSDNHIIINNNNDNNQTKPLFSFNFSTPIKNFEERQRKKHNSFIEQHMKSASKTIILESPKTDNRNTQNINPIANILNIPFTNISNISNMSTNNHNNNPLSTNKSNQNGSNSTTSSLRLTEHNLSKHNQSLIALNEQNDHKSRSKSLSSFSSVLSKHKFGLLQISEISSPPSPDNYNQSKQCKPKNTLIGKKNREYNGIQNKLSFVDLTCSENGNKILNNNNSYLFKTPTTYSRSTKNPKSVFSKFLLDLCSSEEDDESAQNINNKNKTPFIDDRNDFIPSLPINNKNNKKYQTTQLQITKKRKKIIMDKKRENINKTLCDQILSYKEFKKQRDQYTLLFFDALNKKAFENKLLLNDNLTYSWCKTLNKTAGDCRLITRNKTRKAHIRLATKVLDTLEKLKQTLCHEMCHAMAWIVHSSKKPPHGSHFKYWVNKAQLAFNDIRVTTCHNYKIKYKFQWKCIQCQYVFGRHSKSIKVETHRCGVCKGMLQFMGRLKPDGSYVKTQKKAPSKFTIFMKENMSAIKKQYPGAKHGYVMKILSEKYKLCK